MSTRTESCSSHLCKNSIATNLIKEHNLKYKKFDLQKHLFSL